jgi:hypothetical protein
MSVTVPLRAILTFEGYVKERESIAIKKSDFLKEGAALLQVAEEVIALLGAF